MEGLLAAFPCQRQQGDHPTGSLQAVQQEVTLPLESQEIQAYPPRLIQSLGLQVQSQDVILPLRRIGVPRPVAQLLGQDPWVKVMGPVHLQMRAHLPLLQAQRLEVVRAPAGRRVAVPDPHLPPPGQVDPFHCGLHTAQVQAMPTKTLRSKAIPQPPALQGQHRGSKESILLAPRIRKK